jgi:AcrR family transcriptional regulator
LAQTEQERRPLTRERILETAVRLMDREGLEAVSMRRLGRELGVEAMSLYNHVRDKDDVLLGMIETVMTEFEVPDPGADDWVERVRGMARSFRTLLLAHPNAIPLFTESRGPMRDPEALVPLEAAFDALLGAGLDPEGATHVYRALVGYVMGYVVLETAGFLSAQAGESWPAPDEWARTVPVDRFPRLLQMLPHLMECDSLVEFEYGLDVMLRGLRDKLGG